MSDDWEYLEFCRENDLDPDDSESRDAFRQTDRDPYKQYGVSRSDFY